MLIPSKTSINQRVLQTQQQSDYGATEDDAADLTPEQMYERDREAIRMETLEGLAQVLLLKRQEAFSWRQQCGIESDWLEDEQFYQSIDPANPEGETNVGKPMSPDGGVAEDYIVPSAQDQVVRSSVFIPITRAYVDAAGARVADMLLPNDDRPWQIRATPEPEAIDVVAQEVGAEMTPVARVSQGMVSQMIGEGPTAGASYPMQAPGFAPQAPAQQGLPNAPAPGLVARPSLPLGVASSALSEEEKAAEEANKIIEDWLVECQWHAEVRKVIEDAALVGTGILKGPFPMQIKLQKLVRGPSGLYELKTYYKVKPVSKRVHYRNFWPDPAGGENHQDGSYCWERDNISSRKLRDLLDDPTYAKANILRALQEGPSKKSGRDQPYLAWELDMGVTFPMDYFYGDLTKEMMIAAGVPDDELPEGELEAVAVPCCCIMVNDLVIKVMQAPLDMGGFCYDVFPWQRRPGIPWGKGIARQVRTPQRMLNGAARATMDNAGLCSGPILAMRKGWVESADGDNTIRPRKVYDITSSAPPDAKIENIISFTNISSNLNDLMAIMDKSMRFAEDATGLPMLMQGQQGEATTTATGMTILNNNGSTVLRRIARTFDDCVTEPHIRRYYYWLLADPDVRESAKRDFQVDALGSTYLVDRDMQAQNLNQLYPLFVQHPDVHPGRLAEEVAQANRIAYKRIMKTDAEKAEDAKKPPPEAPQITVAKIREAGQDQRHQKDSAIKEGELQAKFELGLADLAQKGNISEDNIKALLATTLMRMQDGRAAREHQTGDAREQRSHERTSAIEDRDAVEPPGKAPAGEGVSR